MQKREECMKKFKDIAKIIGIWIGVFLIFTSIFAVISEMFSSTFNLFHLFFNIVAIPFTCIVSLLYLFIDVLVALLVLYFLFKKIKSIKVRMILTAFLIPFSIFIKCFLGYHIFDSNDPISYIMLEVFLAITFVAILCAPRTLVSVKKEICTTCILMGIFALLFGFFGTEFLMKIRDSETIVKLNQYEIIIKNVENYKKQNGVYPDKVEDTVKIYKKFVYVPAKNKKYYNLSIMDENDNYYGYNSVNKTWKSYGKCPIMNKSKN